MAEVHSPAWWKLCSDNIKDDAVFATITGCRPELVPHARAFGNGFVYRIDGTIPRTLKFNGNSIGGYIISKEFNRVLDMAEAIDTLAKKATRHSFDSNTVEQIKNARKLLSFVYEDMIVEAE